MSRKLLIMLMALVCATSCLKHRPLDVLSTSVMIDLNNDYTMPYRQTYTKPDHFRIDVYDQSSGLLDYKDFTPEPGGNISGIPGSYVFVACNYDEGHMIITGEDDIRTFHISAAAADNSLKFIFEQCKAKASEIITKDVVASGAPGYESAEVSLEPENFWIGDRAAVVPPLAESDSTLVIPVDTRFAFRQGRIVVTNIGGLQYVSSIRVFLTNFCAGQYLIGGGLDRELTAITFTLAKTSEPKTTYADFNYFGVLPDSAGLPHTAYLIITDTAGGQYLCIYDVTDQIHDGFNADILISADIDVPEPQSAGGGGFAPEVSNWTNVYIDVPLGQEED